MRSTSCLGRSDLFSNEVSANMVCFLTIEMVEARLVQPGVGGVVEAHALQHAVGAIGHQLLDGFHGVLLPEIDHLGAGSHLRTPTWPLQSPWQRRTLAGSCGTV